VKTLNLLHSRFNTLLSFLLGILGVLSYEPAFSEPYSSRSFLHNILYSKQPQSQYTEVWERLRNNYHFITPPKNTIADKHIQKFITQYSSDITHWRQIGIKASPYLFYIVEQLEARNMPGELALLPMLESAFEPRATSNKGAAGLWQFIPGTGRSFGLKQDVWYDGRRDITASTRAALDYLTLLHKQFNHNWMLALAAYNAGEGRVQKAIDRNKQAGKPTTFWYLDLPKETREYVPKLLALAKVVEYPERHSISLPPIENKPYFIPVDLDKSLDFNKVAKLANIKMEVLKGLNPGYRRASTHPNGPRQLLLPIANATKLLDNLSGAKKSIH